MDPTPLLPLIRATARRAGPLQPADREDLESFLALAVLKDLTEAQAARGRGFVIGFLRREVVRWRWNRSHLTEWAIRVLSRAPVGSPEWDRLPERTRRTVARQLAIARAVALEDAVEEADPRPGPEALSLLTAEWRAAEAALAHLTERERAAFVLREGWEFTFSQIAGRLGLSESRAFSLCRQARRRLRGR
jgi:RNA polymerase sigma factor (sigma-70 family)